MNTKGELLVGERIDRPGAWQLPQGGVDQGESVVEAASRELFEEMGVEDGHHVEFVGEVPSDVSSELRDEVAGGWLKENGYAGQELRFVLFRTVSAGLEGHTPTGNNGAGAGAEAAAANSPSPVRLTGLGGEPAEFSAAKWTPLEEVVAAAWENKRPAYEKALSVWAAPLVEAESSGGGDGGTAPRPHGAEAVDFSGVWSRVAAAAGGGGGSGDDAAVAYLEAHGHEPSAARA